MSQFQSGDRVHFVGEPALRGAYRETIPADAERDLPESASVDIWIPEGYPGFVYTGVYENFWCDPAELAAG